MTVQHEHPLDRIERAARQVQALAALARSSAEDHSAIETAMGVVADLAEAVEAAAVELTDKRHWRVQPVEASHT